MLHVPFSRPTFVISQKETTSPRLFYLCGAKANACSHLSTARRFPLIPLTTRGPCWTPILPFPTAWYCDSVSVAFPRALVPTCLPLPYPCSRRGVPGRLLWPFYHLGAETVAVRFTQNTGSTLSSMGKIFRLSNLPHSTHYYNPSIAPC